MRRPTRRGLQSHRQQDVSYHLLLVRRTYAALEELTRQIEAEVGRFGITAASDLSVSRSRRVRKCRLKHVGTDSYLGTKAVLNLSGCVPGSSGREFAREIDRGSDASTTPEADVESVAID